MTALVPLTLARHSGDHTQTIAALVREHDETAAKLSAVSSMLAGDPDGLVEIFHQANSPTHWFASADLFRLDPALAELGARFWARAIDLTDVKDCMSATRRDAWRQDIDARRCPPFTLANAKATLLDLLGQRETMFAERVESVFRALSGKHVTNTPKGFRAKMIIEHAFDGYSTGYRHDAVHDLRACVAKLRGLEAPDRRGTTEAMKLSRSLRCAGEDPTVTLDGGALRMRVFKNGNAHLWVHDECALALNDQLAALHPHAIPEKHRSKKGKAREARPLRTITLAPHACGQLAAARLERRPSGDMVKIEWSHHEDLHPDVTEVLRYVGACEIAGRYGWYLDAATASSVILAMRAIAIEGALPEQRSHQFYATPEHLAQYVVDLAEIGPKDRCLEPSAGKGAIARLLPFERTVVCEISPVHCELLDPICDDIYEGDFFELAGRIGVVDRVVMNPPFDRGMWREHVETAARLLSAGGRLVSVVPDSASAKDFDAAVWAVEVSEETFDGMFAGCSVSVRVLTLTRA